VLQIQIDKDRKTKWEIYTKKEWGRKILGLKKIERHKMGEK